MALHLYLINRGILITPFHNMTLCCPDTREKTSAACSPASTRRSASCSPYPARGRPEMHFADPREAREFLAAHPEVRSIELF